MNEPSKSAKHALTADGKVIAQRFCDRLDSLLDLRGAPKLYRDRLQFLIRKADLELPVAEACLSASFIPDLIELNRIAMALGADPGYFINSVQPPAFRSLKRIQCLSGGETIHLELPRGFIEADFDENQLGWLNGVTLPTVEVVPSDLVVIHRHAPFLEDSVLYVLEINQRFSGYVCKRIQNSKVMLTGSHKPEGIVLSLTNQGSPIPEDLLRLGIDSINRVVCIIRSYRPKS